MIEQKDIIVVDITDKILEGAGDILEGVDYYPHQSGKQYIVQEKKTAKAEP